MKNKGLYKVLLLVVLSLVMVLSLAACMKKEDYYTKGDVEALIKVLETALSETSAASNAKIEALETEYLTKLEELEVEDAATVAAIEALTATYHSKVTELEAADKANGDALKALRQQYLSSLDALQLEDRDTRDEIDLLNAQYTAKIEELEAADKANAEELAALKTQYATDLAALEKADAENKAAIEALKADLATKTQEIKDAYDAKITSIETLIEGLQAADTENVKRIATLEAQVQQLLNPTRHTVSFDTDGGSAAPAAQEIEACGKVTMPAAPTKENYTFIGWYCEEELWSFSGHSVTKDITLVAKWRSNADHTEFLDFYPLPDGTYSVMAGKTLYLSEVMIPATYNGKPVTQILSQAFMNAPNLESITIPASVTSIGWTAFGNCTSLTAIYITDIAAWCNVTFSNSSCNPLYYAKNLYLNGNLVTDLVIPAGVTSIGDWAFYNCSSLTSITIPASVTSIDREAFEGCSSLTSINYQGTVAAWQAISKGSSWNYNTGTYTITCTDGTISKNGTVTMN